MGKVIIFSAPSGSGKSTIIHHILKIIPQLEFSISATSRSPRGTEKTGVDYHFLSTEDFKGKIANNEFVEWEEVYTDSFYGTLKSEIERIWAKGNVILFDVDVKGGIKLKKIYNDCALSIFIMPPSIHELRKRLIIRGTDSHEAIERRIQKAEEEISYAKDFDVVLVNDSLNVVLTEAESIIKKFINT